MFQKTPQPELETPDAPLNNKHHAVLGMLQLHAPPCASLSEKNSTNLTCA